MKSTVPSAERLRAASGENLLRIWRNAAEILVNQSRPADHQPAHETQTQIELEWSRRCADGVWPDLWLPWPRTVSSPAVGGGIYQKPVPDDGMLKAMGYHVGQTKPVREPLRRLILQRIVDGALPPVETPDYVGQWGEPGSSDRLAKLARTLANLAFNEERRGRSAEGAYGQRKADLNFLYDQYYVGKFDFVWPLLGDEVATPASPYRHT
jgi:hypothetical protein